jgi:hypothetical protein
MAMQPSPIGTTPSYDLHDVIAILCEGGNKKLYDTRKVKPTFIDSFLFQADLIRCSGSRVSNASKTRYRSDQASE